ncbi:nickel pincer cofactor biosynthesis protein LarC [Modestobacter sp. I12A-02628]|uniref:Pyridinium-3,5-bisthiocarboxylic acid mononucleotide nickel insertion protein n=1 Tax=Goekera deserti TaxID=2497753 RepID=A0A7K3WI22_9ACTN|nr:nickel pincer cofactor biosynthesis protein LarC [Goekera deserti]MPQ97820.1 nickel pincer cofactor biosynthesis protein LarC [Goekera deserti]NDI48465.1 nickel pincer cofactor biosynthesis protein LarC [Goekera deserti]NEL56067.1 nickel pincer cofactor biosynthesis protein LarC [Goekera deserti]
MTIGWLDLAAGASGDMLLGALVDAGVPLEVPARAVGVLGVERVTLRAEGTSRHGLGATRVHVEAPDTIEHRTWGGVRRLLEQAPLHPAVREGALAVFERLAVAEGRVHRVPPEQVHFHEVGALDALADVVGVVAGFEHLGLDRLTASPVALGSGSARGAHGVVPVPGPAVLALLAGVPVLAGPVPAECCTPTGAALLAARVQQWTTMPPMRVTRVGSGAGGRDPVQLPNVVRLVLGEPTDEPDDRPGAVLLETNVDDLDPRLWPGVLTGLLAAGASDAWLTPILMKKGRPAHTLHVLCSPAVQPAVERAVFTGTSTIGLRVSTVGKRALAREQHTVDVLGGQVGVKVARLDGQVVNVSVEYEDVAALAGRLGLPVKEALRAATAAAETAHPAGSGIGYPGAGEGE